MKHRLVEVKWDTSDGDWNPLPGELDLPEIVTVPGDIDEDDISDYLSDRWGYCHFGWNFVRKEQVST
jgi:hypothetical protein